MKTKQILITTILAFFAVSCASSKKMESQLYDTKWELEFITGIRIAFDGLYPDKKPQITFNKETKKVSGIDSCNGYSADYAIDGNAISFGDPGPTTMKYCGEGDTVFLKAMKEINKYHIDSDGKLILKKGDLMMMRFKKL